MLSIRVGGLGGTSQHFFSIILWNIRRVSNIIRNSINTASIVYLFRIDYTGFSARIKHFPSLAGRTCFGCEVEIERKCTTDAIHSVEEWFCVGTAL